MPPFLGPATPRNVHKQGAGSAIPTRKFRVTKPICMRHLLALLLFAPYLCLAQVPTSVPMDGLVAWYGFNADAQDSGPNSWHGTVHGSPEFVVDRFGNAGQALQLCHNGQYVSLSNWFASTPNQTEWTMSIWFKRSPESSTYPDFLIGHRGHFRDKYIHGGAIALSGQSRINTATALSTAYAPDNFEDDWHSIVFRSTLDSLELYFDGVHVSGTERQGSTDDWTTNYHGTFIGGNGHDPEWAGTFEGTVDDAGVWSRALDPDEISFLVLGAEAVHGCTEQTACNYDEEANVDNGSCEYGCFYCGEGTYWDSTLQECIAVIPSADTILVPIPSCGAGTVWDPVNEECIIAVPTDNDLDGCISASDVLNLLSTFGTCPPIPEWPDAPDNTWVCGDPVTYWDYDYATVLIGDQCWFAENLRSTQYQNGDNITLWDYPGEVNTYGIGHYTFKELNPANVDTFGLLYTWHAATHELHLCPAGWRTPSEQDYQTLIEATDVLTGNPSPTHRVNALQSPSNWTLGSGTNATGFAALPGSQRTPWGSLGYGSQYEEAFWWTTNEDNGNVTNLSMAEPINGGDKIIGFGTCDNPNDGMSVRCVKD